MLTPDLFTAAPQHTPNLGLLRVHDEGQPTPRQLHSRDLKGTTEAGGSRVEAVAPPMRHQAIQSCASGDLMSSCHPEQNGRVGMGPEVWIQDPHPSPTSTCSENCGLLAQAQL